MADLEKHAIKRDKRFLVRLVVLLAIATLVGMFIFSKLTSSDFGSCLAGGFGSVTEPPAPAEGASE
jgi:hypothetical protein